MKTKVHHFTLMVRTDESKIVARAAVLTAFASRQPDGCEFCLLNAKHADSSREEIRSLKTRLGAQRRLILRTRKLAQRIADDGQGYRG